MTTCQGSLETVAASCSKALLALSTFRRSGDAVDLAIQSLKPGGALTILYVVDVNLSRYVIGFDAGISSLLRKQCEAELLRKHEEEAFAVATGIAERARAAGLAVNLLVRIGRFGLVAAELARDISPELIVTTRSKRPEWVKRLFGSPVDYLIEHAACKVIDA